MHPYIQNIIDSIPEKWPEKDKIDLLDYLRAFGDLANIYEQFFDLNVYGTPPSPEREALLKELERVFPDGGSTTEPCLMLGSFIRSEKKHVQKFLATAEIREDWRSIPPAIASCCYFGLIGSPKGACFVLPALLKAHLLYSSSNCIFTLFSSTSSEANSMKKHLSLLNQQQRDLVQAIAQESRRAGNEQTLLSLLPWEWALYAKKAKMMRPIEWIKESYPELGLTPFKSNQLINQARAAIPSSWNKDTREGMIAFLNRIESDMNSYKKNEKKEARETSLQEEELILRIQKAFAGVSDEGTERLLLAGEAEDEYMLDFSQSFLSKFEMRGDWQSIPPELLYACGCALSYVDAVGYRYLVPAFICAELYSHQIVDMVICLSASESLLEHCAEKFSLFNEEQKAVVVDYMNIKRGQDSVTMDMALLLPWEMVEYQQQSEYEKASAWLRAKYPCLRDVHLEELSQGCHLC